MPLASGRNDDDILRRCISPLAVSTAALYRYLPWLHCLLQLIDIPIGRTAASPEEKIVEAEPSRHRLLMPRYDALHLSRRSRLPRSHIGADIPGIARLTVSTPRRSVDAHASVYLPPLDMQRDAIHFIHSWLPRASGLPRSRAWLTMRPTNAAADRICSLAVIFFPSMPPRRHAG